MSAADAGEHMGERALVETGVRTLGESKHGSFGVVAAGKDGMHVDVVAGFLASPQGEHLASHHVVSSERWSS